MWSRAGFPLIECFLIIFGAFRSRRGEKNHMGVAESGRRWAWGGGGEASAFELILQPSGTEKAEEASLEQLGWCCVGPMVLLIRPQ